MTDRWDGGSDPPERPAIKPHFSLSDVWWRPPRLRGSEVEGERRHATWLELFYDLVFVVAVAALADALHHDLTLAGFLTYAALFVPVWWCWIGPTFYATRFDTDDLEHRVVTFLQMGAVGALAINVRDGLGDTSTGFAIAYVISRALLILQYTRAGRHVPTARPLTDRYAVGFGIAAIVWLASVVVPPPFRFGLWGAGLILDFLTPLGAGRLHARIPPDLFHLPERFGLFTIIVLGESVVATVAGLSNQRWDVVSILTALLGLGLAFSLWWIYFDHVDDAAIPTVQATRRVGTYQIWLYTHLPLMIGLAAAGVGVEVAVSSPPLEPLEVPARLLLAGSVALCLVCLGVIHLTSLRVRGGDASPRGAAVRIGVCATGLGLAFLGRPLWPVAVLAVLVATCVAQVDLTPHSDHPNPAGEQSH